MPINTHFNCVVCFLAHDPRECAGSASVFGNRSWCIECCIFCYCPSSFTPNRDVQSEALEGRQVVNENVKYNVPSWDIHIAVCAVESDHLNWREIMQAVARRSWIQLFCRKEFKKIFRIMTEWRWQRTELLSAIGLSVFNFSNQAGMKKNAFKLLSILRAITWEC